MLMIDDDQVIELADALGALTYNGRNSMTLEQVIRSGNAQLFGSPLRVRYTRRGRGLGHAAKMSVS